MASDDIATDGKATDGRASDAPAGGGEAAVLMYESHWCGYCRAARRLLESKGWPIDARVVDGDAALRAEMSERAGRTSVPQIWIGRTHVGGYDDLASLEQDGELDALHARELGGA